MFIILKDYLCIINSDKYWCYPFFCPHSILTQPIILQVAEVYQVYSTFYLTYYTKLRYPYHKADGSVVVKMSIVRVLENSIDQYFHKWDRIFVMIHFDG